MITTIKTKEEVLDKLSTLTGKMYESYKRYDTCDEHIVCAATTSKEQIEEMRSNDNITLENMPNDFMVVYIERRWDLNTKEQTSEYKRTYYVIDGNCTNCIGTPTLDEFLKDVKTGVYNEISKERYERISSKTSHKVNERIKKEWLIPEEIGF